MDAVDEKVTNALPQNTTEPFTIVGLVLAFLFWPAGLVLSIIALRRTPVGRSGRGLAIAGIVISAVGASVVLLVGIVIALSAAPTDVVSSPDQVALPVASPITGSQSAGSAGSAQPARVMVGGGILVNTATAKGNAPTLDIFEDFQCPVCGQFERTFGPTISMMAKAGDIKLVVHTMSFLDVNLRNDSSQRSANAAACAAGAGKFLEYNRAVFAAQPAQEGAGYTDVQLSEFANAAGITGPALATWQTCTSSGQHAQYVTDTETAAERDGVYGAPVVKLQGRDITLTLTTPEALVVAVRAATS